MELRQHQRQLDQIEEESCSLGSGAYDGNLSCNSEEPPEMDSDDAADLKEDEHIQKSVELKNKGI